MLCGAKQGDACPRNKFYSFPSLPISNCHNLHGHSGSCLREVKYLEVINEQLALAVAVKFELLISELHNVVHCCRGKRPPLTKFILFRIFLLAFVGYGIIFLSSNI